MTSCNCVPSPTMLRWYGKSTHLHPISVGQVLASRFLVCVPQHVKTSESIAARVETASKRFFFGRVKLNRPQTHIVLSDTSCAQLAAKVLDIFLSTRESTGVLIASSTAWVAGWLRILRSPWYLAWRWLWFAAWDSPTSR